MTLDTTLRLPAQPYPVIALDNKAAQEAYKVYLAIAKLGVDDPELAHLPLMIELRAIALDRFNQAFEVLE